MVFNLRRFLLKSLIMSFDVTKNNDKIGIYSRPSICFALITNDKGIASLEGRSNSMSQIVTIDPMLVNSIPALIR